MTGNAKELHNVKQIIPVPIGLPNGTHIMASHRGILSLENELHLAYVLYVHTLKCNLISIAQLCKDMHCTVTFSDYVCISQDHTIRTPIGAGEQCGGIYYYKQGSLGKIQANAITIDNLWHKRLEHNSNQVLACLRKNLAISSQKNDVREICTWAKQTHAKFVASQNKVEFVLELIHCDIWGHIENPNPVVLTIF